MAFLYNKHVSITGISACVPTTRKVNADNPHFPAGDVQTFVKNVGVEEYRVADKEVCTSDLCVAAAEKLLAEMNVNREDIGILVFVSQTPDYHFLPNTACIIQDRLQLSQETLAFDVPLGCSGYVYGLNIIAAYLSGGQIKKGLLLVGDTGSKTVHEKDKSAAMLFGDAGAATLLEYNEAASGIHFHMATDGSGYKAIIIPDGGFRNPFSERSLVASVSEEGLVRTPRNLHLEGLDVFSFGITEAPKTVKKLYEKLQITSEEVDYAVFHQANKMMNEKIRKKLGLPEEKVPYSLQKFGNTSSASIPLTIVTELRNAIIGQSAKVILCGFGVGLSWGTAYTTLDHITVPELTVY